MEGKTVPGHLLWGEGVQSPAAVCYPREGSVNPSLDYWGGGGQSGGKVVGRI